MRKIWSRIFFEPKNMGHTITPLLHICMLFGIVDIQYPYGKLRNGLSNIYRLLLLIVHLGCLIPSQKFIESIPQRRDDREVELWEIYANLYGHVIIFIYIVYNGLKYKKGTEEFMNKFVHIEHTLNQLGVSTDRKIMYFKLLRRCIVLFVSLMTISYIDLLVMKSNFKSSYSVLPMWFTLHFPMAVAIISNFAFINSNTLLKSKLRQINRLLNSLQVRYVNEFPRYPAKLGELSSDLSPVVDRKIYILARIRVLYRETRDFIRQTSSFHHITNMATAGLAFVVILVECYICYRLIFVHCVDFFVHKELIIRLIWISLFGGRFFLIARSASKIEEEALKTGDILVALEETHPRIQKEIQAFSLEILCTKNISKNTKGIFTLDYTLLEGMVTSIVTYLIFMIQGDYAVKASSGS